MNRRKLVFFIGIVSSIILILSACSQKTETQIFETLEEVVRLENGFRDQQEPLIGLEEEEKAKYEEILELGLKEREKIISLADEAIALSEQRQEHIDLERDSIVSAQNEFQKAEKQINDLDDELKTDAQSLFTLMNERYDIHEQLYENYSLGIQYDKELYQLLKEEEVTLEELQGKIDQINKVYEDVYSLNEQFNQKTNDYNNEKLEFYNKAGLNIEQKEENNE